ncbi:lipid-A-disaccharide synthase [Paucibacter sp. APW11]|uniref:Lipid-A-disaccharide synthase n=1 Tax=Roseateles aquae TaxID=3077235 RepID=A0ABU3P8F4_9BURK|nr:lipid-A-disaccharide synthase [Paucibacter sp. APW11]MDT8998490.1 lipid-A-disaccharide synthase [Paucibacter sp. APW11]
MSVSAPRFSLVAGEASGDLLGGLLLAGLRQRWPELQADGIGGPKMAAQGFKAWWPHHKLSVFGYVDALLHLREILGIRKQLGERLLAEAPQAFIGIDAPDFNFALEAKLKAAGIKSIHFVCPSIWAWRAERVEKIRRSVDHVLCLFPFEPALLHKAGIAASYVGHPLADVIPMEPPRSACRAALSLSETDTVVALLPGSRRSEIRYIAEPLLRAAQLMQRQRPELRFIMPVAPGMRELMAPLLQRHAQGLRLEVLDGRSHEALAACDITLVASGTATLEAALFKRPMVIAYRMHWLNWRRIRTKRLQPWVGLPNVLAEDFVVPELLQDACTPEALAREGLAWLDDAARREHAVAIFRQQHELLRCNTAQRATDAIAQVLGA